MFQTTDKTLVSEQLGDDPRHAPFTRALLRAERFLAGFRASARDGGGCGELKVRDRPI